MSPQNFNLFHSGAVWNERSKTKKEQMSKNNIWVSSYSSPGREKYIITMRIQEDHVSKVFLNCETPRQTSNWVVLKNTFLDTVSHSYLLKTSQRIHSILLRGNQKPLWVLQNLSEGLFQACKKWLFFSLGLTWEEPCKASSQRKFRGEGVVPGEADGAELMTLWTWKSHAPWDLSFSAFSACNKKLFPIWGFAMVDIVA